jgi:uncharacterized protein involved in tolerance to divalent cations
MAGDWALLTTCTLEYQAAILEAALKEEGIACVVINRKDSAYRFMGEVEVFVKKEDYLMAKRTLEKTEL